MELRKTLLCAVITSVVGVYPAGEALAGLKHFKRLSVVGTHIEYDAFGLPAYLEGDVYYVGGKEDGKFAGTYEEDLTPVFFDGQFVGTEGVSVFRLHDGDLTTANVSFLVGFEDGAFLVASQGEVVEGTGKLTGVTGGFASSSAIILGPDFVLEVDIELDLEKPKKQRRGKGH